MGFKIQETIVCAAVLLAVPFFSFAQTGSEQRDSLVRLLKGSSLELVERDGRPYRKATDATFFHNDTYLVCDTALWDVDSKLIKCLGNVQLIQEETVLTSDRLDYLIEEDLAQFRGSVVQLQNKQENILRTSDLDYNTRDSVAFFRGGASMKDREGQIIECENGTYESANKLFTFNEDVNMFTDSIFVRTQNMTYDSDRNKANFIAPIDFWKDGNMLSSQRGWYERNSETFFFRDEVHAQSEDQEVWCDTLYFFRLPNDIKMYGRAQVQDTTRNVYALADYIYYQDTLSRVTMEKNAAVAIRTKQEDKVDTLYCGADRFVYHTKKRCDIPDSLVAEAQRRLEEIMADPVAAYRKKAAKEAEAQAAAELAAKHKNRPGAKNAQKDASPKPEGPSDDTVAVVVPDSLSVEAEAVSAEPDTSKIGFLTGLGRVRMFRRDIQLSCDSLLYSDIDSVARFYVDPIIWNEGNRQYTADSMFVLVRNGGMDRASLMSNAFILTKETEDLFDQIRGTDAMAFFDSESALRRFDALGGATAMFYLKENEEFATVNKVESKMLSALMKDGSVERVYYFDEPHNDAYPIAQLPEKERRMKGFDWRPEGRPESPADITTLQIRPSERLAFNRRPKTSFKRTDKYFPGYMDNVYKSIEEAKERARMRELRQQREKARLDSLEAARADSLSLLAAIDSLALADSVLVSTDSLKVDNSVMASPDSLGSTQPSAVSDPKKLQRDERREAAELRRSMRIARRDAKWAEKDARDKAKAEAKEQKKLERQKAKEDRLRKKRELQEARDEEKLRKYMEYYENQKIRNEGKQKLEPSGERPQGAPVGGELPAAPEPERETS